MHYRRAIQAIIGTHLLVWGYFFEDLPGDVLDLDQPALLQFFLNRVRFMRNIIEENKVSLIEIVRFKQEYDIMRLLLVITAWASSSQEVPFTEGDLGNLFSALQGLCVAGVPAEEGEDIMDNVVHLLKEGFRSKMLPDSLQFLLPAPETT